MTPQPFKLGILINSLAGGGAERVVSTLAASLLADKSGWKIVLILLDDDIDQYVLPSNLEVIRLRGNGAYLQSFFKLHAHFKSRRYDSILSFLTRSNCLNILLKYRFGHCAVISERGDANSRLGSGLGGVARRALVRLLYPRADRVIPVSHGVGKRLVADYGVSQRRLTVIYNSITLFEPCSDCRSGWPYGEEVPSGRFIVAMGRLEAVKGFDLLIAAFSQSDYYGDLVILGDGPERAKLKQLAAGFGIESRVYLPGFVSKPTTIIEKADAFVLPSRAEGFPNALGEAMTTGCPVLATNCQFGPAEILDEVVELVITGPYEAKYGLMVPPETVSALKDGINLIVQADRKAYWSERGRRRAADFSVEAAVRAYVSVINGAYAQANRAATGAVS